MGPKIAPMLMQESPLAMLYHFFGPSLDVSQLGDASTWCTSKEPENMQEYAPYRLQEVNPQSATPESKIIAMTSLQNCNYFLKEAPAPFDNWRR